MPIPISNNYSYVVSKAVQCIENPNRPWGTLIEEIPSDIGRTYQSYKRGGFLEGIERFTKETLSACVWVFGIPIFKKVGDLFFEHVLHTPMDMDYSTQTIENVSKYLKTGANPNNLDVSDLAKYANFDFSELTAKELGKNIKTCKTISTVSAIALNCLMMGIVIPRLNQHLTKNRLAKINAQKQDKTATAPSFDEFRKKTSSKGVSFKGKIDSFIRDIPYLAENNNTFRLISTDIFTLIGRAATSRNKYEALENTIVDAGSIYLYNFCAHNIKDFICSKAKIPQINPMVYQTLIEADENTIKSAMDKVAKNTRLTVDEMFDKDFANKIYNFSTFGKYTKLNRYVKPKDKENIDKEIYNYIKTLSKRINYDETKNFDLAKFRQLTKSYNVKSALSLALGFGVAIYGLSTFLPKLAFKITTLLTGKNEFTGIAHFDENKDVNKS